MADQVVRLRPSGPPTARDGRPACHAPFTSMYLDPTGRVTACCANSWHPLGHVSRQSLPEIWRGPAARRLRSRLAGGDLGLGCELCAAEVAIGSPATAQLHEFDALGPSSRHPDWPAQLELALSNACNLQCLMCNGELSSSIRIHREGRAPLPTVYDDRFFDDLDAFLPHLRRVKFLGGEPFLGAEPLRVMGRLVDLGLAPDVYVTTNGTQWNDRVRRVLSALPVDVSVSVDGFRRETVEAIRVGVDHAALLANIERYREATSGNGGGFSLTFCLLRQNWSELGDVLAWGDRLDALVGVSTVTNPPHLSLHRAPDAELDHMVAALRAQDPQMRGRLTRNRHVWERELARIETLAAQRTAGSAPGWDGLAADAGRMAAAFADERGVHRIHADGSQVASRVEPDPADVFGADLRSLPGGPTSGIVEQLTGALGEVVETSLALQPGGVEERRIRFRRPDATTEVRAFLAPTGPETHVWALAAREGPPDDSWHTDP